MPPALTTPTARADDDAGDRRAVAVNVDRAEALLRDGRGLVRRLSGWARLAVSGYVAGGLGDGGGVAQARLRRPGARHHAVAPRYRRADGAPAGAGMTAADQSLEAAYRECERITREQARNFSWGIRLLPEPKRTALSAVYAVARRIDDIGDGTLPADEKLRLLKEARVGATRPGGAPDDPVLRALCRRRATAADPAGGVRRTRRRLRDGRRRTALRDDRRPGRVLPLRRRFDRAAVPRACSTRGCPPAISRTRPGSRTRSASPCN